MSTQSQNYLSDKAYWSSLYDLDKLPRDIDVADKSLRNYFRRCWHKKITKIVSEAGLKAGSRFMEIGCGGSVWLPYFANEHKFEVTGLDYSERGCAASEHILRRSGSEGEIICADLFAPPEKLIGAFDMLLSVGVVEHFSPPASVISSCANFLKPGGVMLTVIPNLTGLNGAGTKFFDPDLFAIHVPMTSSDLQREHEAAGLQVVECDYLTPFWISDWKVPSEDTRTSRRILRNMLWYPSAAVAAGVWLVDEAVGNRIPSSRLFSPWVLCRAFKPL